MRCEDVIRQLQEYMPRHTALFGDDFSVSSMTRAGTTVTVITTSAHGLVSSDKVFISGAIAPIGISPLTQTNNIATAVTVSDHDLTEGYQSTIEISGAVETDYNGDHTLLKVPNRRKFTYQISNDPTSPATGTPVLHDTGWYNGYNGLHQITIVDTTTFTFETDKEPNSPAQGTIITTTATRISGAVSIERAAEAYTPQSENRPWLFVVLGDVTVSKDRAMKNDATTISHPGIQYRQRLIQPFSIYIFLDATNSIAGREVRDLAETIALPLYASLLGTKNIISYLSEEQWAEVTFNGHRFFGYNGSYYIHEYNFETVGDITYNDTVGEGVNVAFRDIDLSFVDGKAIAAIDLDEEPL